MQASWNLARCLLSGLIASCLLVVPSVQALDESVSAFPPLPPRGGASAFPPLPPRGGATVECKELPKEILGFYRSLPTVFRTSNEAADSMARDTQRMLQKCHQALKTCDSTANPEQYAEVQFVTAKLVYILSKRYRMQTMNDLKKDPTVGPDALGEELHRRFKDYLSQVHDLARRAYETLGAKNPLRPRALEVLAFSLHEAKEYQASVKVYKEFTEKFPDDERLDKVVNALGRAYLEGDWYDSGIDLLEKAVKDHYASESYPYFIETLRKLNVGKGDVAGFERAVKQGMIVFPLKRKSSKATRQVRDVCDRLFLYYGFWKGYGRMASGDLEGARAAFTQHVGTINTRENELHGKGQQLRPEYAIYRGRSDVTLSFLDRLAGQPAPRELDLLWVTDEEVTLSDSVGKVVAILFRGVDHRRSKEFMADLSHICAVNPDFEMVSVHYLRRQQSPLLRQEALREELDRLGYSAAAGFDPDAESQSLFRDAYGVKVGSPSLTIVDRDGNLVWFMEDPRALDVQFVKAIMTRVARES